MVVREGGEVKGIQGIAVQEDGTTQVSITDTLNIVGGGTVTDVGGVATINIPYGVTWIREDVPAGSATYTFVNSPATSTSFLVFTDSGTLLFLGVDYTYDPSTETITFLSLGNDEAAYIWNAHASVSGGGIGDMVKAVYDPTNINSSAFNMDNFIDGTNKHYISTSEKTAISTALQPNDNVSELVNDAGYITSASLPTKVSDLQNDSGFITGINSGDVTTALGYTPYDSSNPNGYITSSALSGYQTTANLKTDLTDDSDTYYPSQKAVKTAVDAKQDALSSQTVYTSKGTSTAVPTITTNSLGQVTTISETNIAFPVTSVNGQTGAVTVSGGEDNDYDAVIDTNGTGDYTTIGAAITAGKKRLFVKNGTYTMSSGTLSTGDFKLVGESRNGVIINITYGTISGTIFTLTSDTTSPSNGFLFNNVTFNITYTGEYGYFIMFGGMGAGTGFLKISDCNINVVQATNGCNFYITSSSYNDTLIEQCRIEIYLSTGTFTSFGFAGISRKGTCINSVVVVDASTSLSQGISFEGRPDGTYIDCRFLIGVNHQKSGDIAYLGCGYGIRCNFNSSNYCNFRISGIHESSSFPALGQNANYDSNLNTAITNKTITIWKPNTSYTVGQYVQSGYGLTLAKCITAHTSGDTFDNTKFEEVYGDVYISAILKDCSLTAWGTVILSGVSQYSWAFVLPAVLNNIESNTITFEKQSSSLPSYCNMLVLGYRGFINNGILVDGTSSIHLYLGGESSMFMGNRIVAPTGDIYAGGYGNIITNNTFTYITGNTTPTITQVTSGLNEIANNVIRGVGDWNAL